MPKKHRLSGAAIRAIRSPRRVHGELFSLSISAGTTESARASCVVSKKVAMKAVARNTVKRHWRAVCAKDMPTLPTGTYVFYAKRGAAEASFAALEKDIRALLRTARGAVGR